MIIEKCIVCKKEIDTGNDSFHTVNDGSLCICEACIKTYETVYALVKKTNNGCLLEVKKW